MSDGSPTIPTFELPIDFTKGGGVFIKFVPLAPIVIVPPPMPAKGDFGIDVSRWQGVIDWEKVKADGVKFAGIRATMGITGKDDRFGRNWAEARRVGIRRMAYHYVVNLLPAMGQMDNFFAALGDDLGELPLVLDVEPREGEVIANKTQNTQIISECLARVEMLSGKQPILYTNGPAWQACTTNPGWAATFPLWLAQYNTLPEPNIPAPWSRYAIWQYSATGRIAGIVKADGTPANVDLNRWGTL